MQMDTEAKSLKSRLLVKLSHAISFIFMLVPDVAREREIAQNGLLFVEIMKI